MSLKLASFIRRLLNAAFYFFLILTGIHQSALAEQEPVKSPVPLSKIRTGWVVGTMIGPINVSKPEEGCKVWESQNPGFMSEFIPLGPIAGAGNGPGNEGYNCWYQHSVKTDVKMAMVSVLATYEEYCKLPYFKQSGACWLPPRKDDCKENTCPVCPQAKCGNPINYARAIKEQTETDYRSADGLLELVRYYRSDFLETLLVNDQFKLPVPGIGWRHNFHRSISLQHTGNVLAITRENGAVYAFVLSGGIWKNEKDHDGRLKQILNEPGKAAGWEYTTPGDTVETYDQKGRLVMSQSRSGYKQTFTYQNDVSSELHMVEDSFGRKLKFTYDKEGRTSQLILPDGKAMTYGYDSNGNLASVTYVDSKIRRYVYENTKYLHALTGIVDENGARFATWEYDWVGRPISSEHAGGVSKYKIDYRDTFSGYIYDPLGGASYYGMSPMADGTVKITGSGQSSGAGSTNATSRFEYNDNGNVTKTTDFNAKVTTYDYDLARNLELRRVEASDTPLAQTTTTIWHPVFRLPVEINAPLLKTSFTHDVYGNILTKTEESTSQENNASNPRKRVWTYTYNASGQVLTATGPRTDIVDTTTYTYDDKGNLSSLTNAVGHTTTMSNYDANGRVGQITDPNGLVTTLTYTERGWLKQRVSNADGVSETTTYDYDGVGQMTKVTLPDNSSINYTYDDAHRLTKISDSLGNSINYTLDNMGNRINETVTDASGTLTRQVSRVYNILNRLQKVTGAAQ